MKRLFFLTVLLAIVASHVFIQCSHQNYDEIEMPTSISAVNFKYLDDCNSLSGSLNYDDLAYLSSKCTKTIIRLNGDTKNDMGFISINQEAGACVGLDMNFYYFNIEGNTEETAKEINELMKEGNVHIHCRNGAHRAPAMAAYHLRKIGWDINPIVESIGWEKLYAQPGPYLKYTKILK